MNVNFNLLGILQIVL